MMQTERRQRVAGEVRAAVGRANLSGAELAEQTGIPASTLSRKLRGLSPFTVDDLVVIAATLGVDPAEFFATPTPAPVGAAA